MPRNLIALGLLLAALGCAPQAVAQEPDPPVFDPFRAEKNLEIGEFHLRRGNYDGAIERFLEAIHFKPGFARPMQLLGRAYEKKGFLPEAIEWYAKYLETLPGAPDAGKIRKRLEKLRKAHEREKARRQKSK